MMSALKALRSGGKGSPPHGTVAVRYWRLSRPPGALGIATAALDPPETNALPRQEWKLLTIYFRPGLFGRRPGAEEEEEGLEKCSNGYACFRISLRAIWGGASA